MSIHSPGGIMAHNDGGYSLGRSPGQGCLMCPNCGPKCARTAPDKWSIKEPITLLGSIDRPKCWLSSLMIKSTLCPLRLLFSTWVLVLINCTSPVLPATTRPLPILPKSHIVLSCIAVLLHTTGQQNNSKCPRKHPVPVVLFTYSSTALIYVLSLCRC